MTIYSSQSPLIAIVGATGTGKSQVAFPFVTDRCRFDGEIVNGDAMQLYDGLPILTNKIAPDEMNNIPHHLLGCVKLQEEPWTVGNFTRNALRVIQEIRARGRLPILVGGTHYYTQSLLFQDTQSSSDLSEIEGSSTGSLTCEEIHRKHPILDAPTEQIWARLNEIDPVMANRWHPNDRRRLQNSLKVYLLTGRKASEIYQEQRNGHWGQKVTEKSKSTENGPTAETNEVHSTPRCLRFPTLILWINVASEFLQPRLDQRVHNMVRKGLLSEVQFLNNHLKSQESQGNVVDKSRGIWTAIGYKEFKPLYTASESSQSTEQDVGQMQLEATGRTQAATRHYAKRQIQWIRIKLVHAIASAGISNRFFLLNGNDVQRWDQDVSQPAMKLVEGFLAGAELPEPASICPDAADLLVPKREYDLSDRPDLWVRRACEVCGTTSVTEQDWTRHITSRGHKKAQKRHNRASFTRASRWYGEYS
ncbi:MAG: hypothetical protein M1816_001704 [Peltula sp. TS41687]|nr:MAG: hypothetical protein M1816_001704 [Peltula sp. TS41687]